ncbi:MAG: DUF1549 domain-containing protein, partial [Planctomycetota bacterium]
MSPAVIRSQCRYARLSLGLGSALLLCAFNATLAAAQSTASEIARAFFESKIRPVLIEHCADCHWSDTEASGGLLLDSREALLTGGDLGPAIVPGEPGTSLLIKAIAYEDPDLEMPPDGKLDSRTIADFRKWIREGAFDPRTSTDSIPVPKPAAYGLTVERATEHWSYRPPDTTSWLPRAGSLNVRESTGSNSIVSSAIDTLIDQRILDAGLVAAPSAEPRQLVRRLVFDLHGLPPTAEQIDRFLADRSPNAYQRLVDRLLTSPRYGEHFARRWLDVVRYAESITLRGFVLPQAWRYRDYVVKAYTEDRPFDQMVRDQIAGDLLTTDDVTESQQRAIATGFLAMGNSNLEDQDKTKLEFDHIDEQLETIGRAFLAQTIGCARCHDHKF